MGLLLANRRARPRCRSMPLRPGSLVPEGAGFPKMAADVSVTHRPPLSPEAEAEVETEDATERRAPEEELPPLDPEEIQKRLEHTERQFRNRRKILIRGLPGDVTNQVWGGHGGKYHPARARGEPGDTNAGPRWGASAGESKRGISAGSGETKSRIWGGGWAVMEGETNLGLREDVARGDHRLGRNQVFERGGELGGGGQLWPCWGIVNGLLYWDCGSRDASCSLLR